MCECVSECVYVVFLSNLRCLQVLMYKFDLAILALSQATVDRLAAAVSERCILCSIILHVVYCILWQG